MSKQIRFKGIVATLAQIAADAFAGRISWASDLARPVHYYTDSDYAVLARKDVAETFPSLTVTDQAGAGTRPAVITATGALSNQDAETFRGTIGAQASLGYEPANKAGDTFTGQVLVTDPTAAIPGSKLLISVGSGDVFGGIGFHSDGAASTFRNWGAGVSRDHSCFEVRNFTDDWSGSVDCMRIGPDYLDLSNAWANVLAIGYRIGGVKVVGGRKIGWGAATGTATRTTFATSTVTTAQLAERVKALIDDLTAHGLIGPWAPGPTARKEVAALSIKSSD